MASLCEEQTDHDQQWKWEDFLLNGSVISIWSDRKICSFSWSPVTGQKETAAHQIFPFQLKAYTYWTKWLHKISNASIHKYMAYCVHFLAFFFIKQTNQEQFPWSENTAKFVYMDTMKQLCSIPI